MTQQLPCPPVFVISLTERPRCGALCALLSQLEIPFELVAATDARDCAPEDLAAVYDAGRAMRRVGRAMGRGEIGCALSHREVYRRMLERHCPLALVLEEDAIPGPHFKSLWQRGALLPEAIDVLLLYSGEGYVRRRPDAWLADCALHQATVLLTGTVGYYIRLDCARRLLLSNTPVSMVADWPLDLSSMRQFLVLPMLVGHSPTGSTIDHDRHRKNVLDLYRAPRWFSGLFHLSYVGYALQPQRYEGLASYYRREIARRLRQISSPGQMGVREVRARSHGPPSRSQAGLLARRIADRLRQAAYSANDHARGREPLLRADRAASSTINHRAHGAKLKVGCYANWLDFHDALRFLTPGGSGVWNDVAFVPAGSMQTDWVGIFNQPRDPPVAFDSSPDRVFFAIGEPPTTMHRPLHLGQVRGSTVFTCDSELATQSSADRHYVLTPPMLRTWSVRRSLEQLSGTSVREKPRLLSWITSDTNVLPGHHVRLQFLRRLRKAVDFDLFGRGFRRVYDKWDVLAPYRYSIAFENVRAPWYFTEKLMDCYVCETMPIYIGDPTIADFFPAESLVVIDPDAPDVFERIRAVIHSDAWSCNRDAIVEAKRRVLHQYNLFAMLSQQLLRRSGPAGKPVRVRITASKLALDGEDQVA